MKHAYDNKTHSLTKFFYIPQLPTALVKGFVFCKIIPDNGPPVLTSFYSTRFRISGTPNMNIMCLIPCSLNTSTRRGRRPYRAFITQSTRNQYDGLDLGMLYDKVPR